MSPPRKPHATAVDRRNGAKEAKLNAVGGLRVDPYEPPEGVCAEVKDAWSAFWADRPASLLTPAARVVLNRWARSLDRYIRASSEADQEPLITGSTGQLVANPLYRVAKDALSTVEHCEAQLGIGPLHAAGLGLATINEGRALQQMNAKYAGDEGVAEDEPDPRLRVISGTVED